MLCICCGETEYSQEVYNGHEFMPDRCECEKIKIYVNKDRMWYTKTWVEAIQVLIFMVCLIGFIVSWFVLIWDNEIASTIMGFSVGIGAFNFLAMLSANSRWREDYEDHSMVFNIKEKPEKRKTISMVR